MSSDPATDLWLGSMSFGVVAGGGLRSRSGETWAFTRNREDPCTSILDPTLFFISSSYEFSPLTIVKVGKLDPSEANTKLCSIFNGEPKRRPTKSFAVKLRIYEPKVWLYICAYV
ncbi:unnamed protein product [Linum tenue]|uniref:Uncharacterized protein n=1 Tax=Linum tenue TaxID=586396 RepID=A0AAV0JNW0_9ROSI|nr:unnamed protein product [Linum tenue]CAI0410563.1 unnamed protein product [Linum tenue]